MAKVFFSYSHEDESYRDRLEKHLSPLRHEGLIESWHDRRILAGTDLNNEIDRNINSADIILLLVSASFLGSHYCYSIEMKRAMERHHAKEARVIPVIVHACDWTNTPIGRLLAAPKDGKPIASWAIMDEAYLDVVLQIRAVVKDLHQNQVPISQSQGESISATQKSIVEPPFRSSNLRLRKTFSDYDRDQFYQESFQFIAKYFEASLAELKNRNPGIDTQFRQIDANTFTATIYVSGTRSNECAINLGAGTITGKGISYSSDVSVRGINSYNEMLYVEADDQSMYLKLTGMWNFKNPEAKLSQEGAAEAFWDILIKPLQQ